VTRPDQQASSANEVGVEQETEQRENEGKTGHKTKGKKEEN
jgi:hypothetical protein